MTVADQDARYLERARTLARRGWGMVHPNPLVGCVLVKDGDVVGEGHHQVFGGPHAEIVALEAARSHASGATAYVSLEPCDHHGQTPPCSEALIQAGVARVVFGASDPTKKASGGARRLRDAGVEVVGPLWTPEKSRGENPAFFHTARHASPFVAIKLAMTLDGRISAAPGQRTGITGSEAQQEVHELRRGHDAILVGGGTARTDQPRLTVRLASPGVRPPRRMVLDSSARLDSGSELFREKEAPLHVFTRRDLPEADLARLEGAGAHVHPTPEGPGGLDLASVLKVCWEMGVHSVLCEGGGRLATSLLSAGLAQRLYLFIAPCTLGEEGVPAFPGDPEALGWSGFRPGEAPRQLGRDTLLVFDRIEDS